MELKGQREEKSYQSPAAGAEEEELPSRNSTREATQPLSEEEGELG